ncbi:MAG: Ig-like domain-containing protein [Chloroflexota bacterium]
MKTNHSLSIFRFLSLLASIVLFSMFLTSPVLAQEGYRLLVDRNFGFSAGSQIRGDFTLKISGDQDAIAAVTFLIDGEEMTTITAAPFRYRFNTSSYPEGIHELSARLTLKDGSTVELTPRRFEFASSQAEREAIVKIIVPLLGVVLLLTLVGGGVQMLALRSKPAGRYAPGEARNYGVLGGTICPKCQRPTPLHLWSLNLGVGRWDRCENCGQFSFMRRQSLEVLRAAEAAELQAEKSTRPASAKSEEEKLRELLDQSKYTD